MWNTFYSLLSKTNSPAAHILLQNYVIIFASPLWKISGYGLIQNIWYLEQIVYIFFNIKKTLYQKMVTYSNKLWSLLKKLKKHWTWILFWTFIENSQINCQFIVFFFNSKFCLYISSLYISISVVLKLLVADFSIFR